MNRGLSRLIPAILVAITMLNAASPAAQSVFEQSGFSGGLVVHVGCGTGEFAAELLHGEEGVALHVLDKAGGTVVQEVPLTANPTFDGLIAALGQVYVSLENGTLVCVEPRSSTGETRSGGREGKPFQ